MQCCSPLSAAAASTWAMLHHGQRCTSRSLGSTLDRQRGCVGRRASVRCRQAALQQGAAADGNGEGELGPSAATLRRLGASWNSWWFHTAVRSGQALYSMLISLLDFLCDCTSILPEFVVPSPSQALWRTGIVLAASLAMIVVISTIDSVWLYWYVVRARLGA